MKVLLCYDIKFRRSCVDKITSKKITNSSKSQTGSHCTSSEFCNFETGDPYKEKKNRSTKIGSSLENEDPTNLKHALKTSTSLIKTSIYKYFNNCFIICEMHFPKLKLD